jgi:CHASE2 domain-containing sensor protein
MTENRIWRVIQKSQKIELFTLRLVLIWGVGLWLINASPFGLSDTLDEETQEIIVSIAAPYFPPDGREKDHESAVVVEITDETLKALRVNQCLEACTRLCEIKTSESEAVCRPQCASRGKQMAQEACVGDLQALSQQGGSFSQNDQMIRFPVDNPTEVWPIAYSIHDYLIAKLVELEPAAIMVDITYGAPRRWDLSLDTFGQRVHKAQAVQLAEFDKTTPIYFAAAEERWTGEETALDRMKTDQDGSQFNYIHQSVTRWEPNERWYPMLVGPGGSYLSPASQIYRDLCMPEPGKALSDSKACGRFADEAARAAARQDLLNPDDLQKSMLIRWPYGYAPLQKFVQSTDNCGSYAAEPKSILGINYQKLVQSVSIAGGMLHHSLFESGEKSPIQECRPIPTIRAERLLPTASRGIGEVFEMVEGRVVFLGAYIKAYPDIVDTTLYDRLPGVALHAVAYRNLSAYGTDYFKHGNVLTHVLEGLLWFFIALFATVRIGVYEAFDRGEIPLQVHKNTRTWLNYAIFIVAMMGVLSAFILWAVKIAPVDFLSLAALSGILPLAESILLARPVMWFFGGLFSVVVAMMIGTRYIAHGWFRLKILFRKHFPSNMKKF